MPSVSHTDVRSSERLASAGITTITWSELAASGGATRRRQNRVGMGAVGNHGRVLGQREAVAFDLDGADGVAQIAADAGLRRGGRHQQLLVGDAAACRRDANRCRRHGWRGSISGSDACRRPWRWNRRPGRAGRSARRRHRWTAPRRRARRERRRRAGARVRSASDVSCGKRPSRSTASAASAAISATRAMRAEALSAWSASARGAELLDDVHGIRPLFW